MGNFFNQLDSHLSNQRNPLRAQENTKIRQDKQSPEMVDTIIGRMPNKSQHEIMQQFNNPEMIKEVVGWAAGAPGMKVAAETAPLAKAGITKTWEYMHPEKAAEEFRSTLGEGTSKENINQLGEMVKGSKEKAEKEGKEMYDSVFKKNSMGEKKIYRTLNPSGIHQSAILEKPPIKIKATGDLADKVKMFNENPTLQNAHSLQSQLGTEASSIKPLNISDKQQISKYKNLQKEIINDINTFLKRENPELADEYKASTQFWKENVIPYGKKGTIKKLASGESEDVTSSQIGSTFTKLTPHVKKVLSDIGPEGSKRVLYNALQKAPPGDADKMAKAILDLKRTKGYDQFIPKEMEEWATKMQKQVSRSGLIKDALKISAGATTGGLVGGPTGAAIGAVLPFAKEGALKIAKKLKR